MNASWAHSDVIGKARRGFDSQLACILIKDVYLYCKSLWRKVSA